MIRFSCVLAMVAALVEASPAVAATVAIVSPPNPSPEAAEVLSRVHGELLSVGLGVVASERLAKDASDGRDSRAWLHELIADDKATAVVDVVEDDLGMAVDVWIAKSLPGRFEVTRVSVERSTPNASERLALRAIEALRGSLLELDLAERARQRETELRSVPVTPPKAEASPTGEPRRQFALELGAGMLMSLDGVGPAALPTLFAGWAARPWLLLYGAAGGVGSRSTITTAAGRGRVRHGFAVMGGQVRLRSWGRWSPFVAFGAGAMHTTVDGEAGLGTEGHTIGRWSFLADGSAGIAVRLYGRYYAALAAHVQLAEPYVVVHVVDTAGAASTGRPNVLLRLSLGAWL